MLEPNIKYVVVLPLTSLFAVLYIVGGKRRWKWLVDPPEEWGLFYSQSFLKTLLGKELLREVTIWLGWFFFASSISILLFI